MAFTFIKDVNAYVEQATGYKTDLVKVNLDENTLRVTAYPVDTNGNPIDTTAPLVDKTFSDLNKATAYYEEIIHQLEQGDVIRNV
jgi:hypothetical protein